IDGVYSNPKPPPPYVVTETKFRTAAGEYADSDGSLSKAKKVEDLLGKTRDGKQMSEEWIKRRLPKEIGKKADHVYSAGYESWLMIVGPEGAVVEIYKLDTNARVIGKVKK
ncbi:hypothetical protein BV914_01290, partial [Neisseria dumasiana]